MEKATAALKRLQPFLKAVVAVAGAVVLVVDASLADGIVTTSEWFDVAVAVITAVGVYWTPNKKK